ncbi:ACT domain-containing protein [Rubrivirga marina]|uniref:ACT domain-containing protein n=1 Tax=Rubrivirga marina TaxID=1196024 RepID=UPI000BA9CFC7|nr:ACT domain-containing protein [Rubrivirga marina]
MSADVRALIDRIASALGPEATPERVERVARAVLDARAPAEPARAPAPSRRAHADVSSPPDGATRVVVTAYGEDQPGVLAAITAELSAAGANVLDVSQKVLQGYFTVVLVADLAAGTDLGAVRQTLQSRGEAMGARVLLQHEELFQAMHRP